MTMTTEIVSSMWDHNGSFRVTVAGPWPRTANGERAARRKARTVDAMRLTQWTRLDHVSLESQWKPTRVLYTFTVSRLDRSHYSRATPRP